MPPNPAAARPMPEALPSAGRPAAEVAWHALPPDQVLSRLGSSAEGLSGAEARERLARFGPNSLRPPKQVSTWKIFIDQFRSVVMLLLLGAAGLALLLGDPVDATAIVAVLLINAAVGFFTELKARTAMAALLRLEVPHATVVRDGRAEEVESHLLVPGDVILVEAGQAVPSDARVLTEAELRVNEAPLTGESLPVDKEAIPSLPGDTALADRLNLIYMSTAVVAGTGRAVVVETGMRTELGRIGGLVGGIREERTPLEQRLDALGHRLVWLTFAVTGVVVGLGLLRGEELGHMLETGIALAIAAVPEGLPAVSTVALAVGVARMARRNALVRRLPAVEALGSATVVCTDKTGTLTAGEMTATALWAGEREYEISGAGYAPVGSITRAGQAVRGADDAVLDTALRIGALSNRAALLPEGEGWKIRGDPTEAALLVAAAKGGLDRDDLLSRWPEAGELPFSSERMLMATYHHGADGPVVYTKGAPARVLERCERILTPAGEEPLDAARREGALEHNRLMASRGLRVLGLARGPVAAVDDGALQGLTFVGLVGISDPPAAGVRETIERFRIAGIRTVMITGDQRLTAEAVARELGILGEGDEVVEGKEFHNLGPDGIDKRLPHVSALSRVSPEDKLRIVEAFQRSGEIVAMLGDGVNDAAALKKADIGVAMGIRGTDVAKEAASVVLQDDRFSTIGAAVEEGRVIFDNIRKFVFYLFSCNLAEVFVILFAGLMGLPQPLLPLQILWLNLVTDTFPALSLAVEPGQPRVMQRPPRDPEEAILSAPFIRSIVLYSLMITAVTLAAFLWSLGSPGTDLEHSVTAAFMTLALAQTFHLGNARDVEPVMAWRKATANRWALAAVALTVSLQFLAVYFPPLAELLGVRPLALRDWLVIVPLAALPAVVGQAIAWVRLRRRPVVA
ncbi:MAG TPA: HAD-IC family P-type ATPase [Longimicrobiaceae bacterium]